MAYETITSEVDTTEAEFNYCDKARYSSTLTSEESDQQKFTIKGLSHRTDGSQRAIVTYGTRKPKGGDGNNRDPGVLRQIARWLRALRISRKKKDKN